jgi:hypothetical protein
MKLETFTIGDNTGMAQVQSQLVVLTIHMSKLMKGKEKCEQVWCITCKTKGHCKEEYPTFVKCMAIRAPNPLVEGVGYCEICKTWGNHSIAFPLLQKYQSTLRNLFFNFFKYVGHDEKDCRVFELMRKHTLDAYIIQEEYFIVEGGVPQYNTPRRFNQGG